ncbi:MAG: hypothetical protein ACE5JE_02910 [Thermoplasmata archaeon]
MEEELVAEQRTFKMEVVLPLVVPFGDRPYGGLVPATAELISNAL